MTVLSDLGYEEIDCIVIDIDKKKEKALNIALNKITGEWNKELLADLIKDLQDSDFDVGFTGFELPEIEQLFNFVHDKKITEDDFDVETELQNPPIAKMGDVWLLGRHRVVCGDSTLPETYEKLMAGAKANLVVTDPPYNVNYEGTAGNIQNDHMEDDKFYGADGTGASEEGKEYCQRWHWQIPEPLSFKRNAGMALLRKEPSEKTVI